MVLGTNAQEGADPNGFWTTLMLAKPVLAIFSIVYSISCFDVLDYFTFQMHYFPSEAQRGRVHRLMNREELFHSFPNSIRTGVATRAKKLGGAAFAILLAD